MGVPRKRRIAGRIRGPAQGVGYLVTQTRRRFGGRQPLCGMGVTSRMVVMVMPAACSARSALSRPEPGPETLTSRVRTPCSEAFLPASSAAICAAYGVDLREPLKPIMPALDQEMVLPCASVMVTVVLLKEAFTCATPEVMFLRSRFFTRAGSLAIGRLLLLLAGDRLCGALAGACVGVGALAANWQTLAVAQPAV